MTLFGVCSASRVIAVLAEWFRRCNILKIFIEIFCMAGFLFGAFEEKTWLEKLQKLSS